MNHHSRGTTIQRAITLLLPVIALPMPAHAEFRIWAPEGISFDWHSAANWDPDGVPNTSDDVQVSNPGISPIISADTAAVNSLVITRGSVQNIGHTLNVDKAGDGLLTINGIGGGANLKLFPTGDGNPALNADEVRIRSDGTLELSGSGATATVDAGMIIGTGGTLRSSGDGSKTLTLLALSAINPTVLVNDGRIFADGGTLTLTAVGAGNRNFDLDGATDGGVIEVARGHLRTEAPFNDGFDGTATIGGPDARWTQLSDFELGVDGMGTMTISDGGFVNNPSGFSSIGSAEGSAGAVTVTGTGSLWRHNPNDAGEFIGSLLVGANGGDGTLTIEDGADVVNTWGSIGFGEGSTGRVTVTGAGSTWTQGSTGQSLANGALFVGDLSGGSGTLTVENGGKVFSSSPPSGFAPAGAIAFSTGSSGVVTVTGSGSRWDNEGDLRVGQRGHGTLIIRDDGRVDTGRLFVGSQEGDGTLIIEDGRVDCFNSSISGTATVTGSIWDDRGDLDVGGFDEGVSELLIHNASSVNSRSSTIGGRSAGSIGTVTVTGNSFWDSSDLDVGRQGEGALIIDGSTVFSSNTSIGTLSGSTGTVTVTGSFWRIRHNLSIGGDFVAGDGGTGTLTIQSGSTVNVEEPISFPPFPPGPSGIYLFPDGLLRLEGGTFTTKEVRFEGGGQFDWSSGTLHVDLFEGDLTNPSSGTLAPGRSAGSTTIDGDYTQTSGATLQIEIGGTSPGGTHDLVNITERAFLGGSLQVAMLDGFVPSAGDTFTVLNAVDGIFGVFNNVTTGQRLDTADGVGSFLVHYGPGSAFDPDQIVLTSFAARVRTDLDIDGDVDHDDLALFVGCMTGPDVLYDPDNLPFECDLVPDPDDLIAADFDGDGDVDLFDFGAVPRCFGGPDVPQSPACAE